MKNFNYEILAKNIYATEGVFKFRLQALTQHAEC